MYIISEEKVRTIYPLIAGVSPFGCNNFSETLLVAIYYTDTSQRSLSHVDSYFKESQTIQLGLRSRL